ncbi:CHAT domain-containing protein [Streptomyces sp. NPDC057424]|uniref:CHAT domain-containing tetratricopeptide repeat protein n=1 Tax=Streptomyces sp. NPDC057424 TaxID=3346127 RepID=UPI0036ABA6C8
MARARRTGDTRSVLEPKVLDEARRVWESLDGGEKDLRALHTLGWLHWYRYDALPAGADQEELESVARAFVPCYLGGVGDLPDVLVPHLAAAAASDAMEQLNAALDEAEGVTPALVSLWQRIVADLGPDHDDRPGCLLHLGAALRGRAVHTQDPEILRRAVETLEEAVAAAPGTHSARPGALFNLALCLWLRYDRSGARADLDRAVDAYHEAVDRLPEDHPDRPVFRRLQGTALNSRYVEDGRAGDLDGAVDALEEAVRLTADDDPGLPLLLEELGTLLQTRLNDHGDLDSGRRAVDVLDRAVQITPVGDPGRAGRLSDHALAVRMLALSTGDPADVHRTVVALTEAVRATGADDPERAWRLSGLATALCDRAEITGSQDDTAAAVRAAREAERLTADGHPDRLLVLGNLSTILQSAATRTDQLPQLEEALDVIRRAASRADADDPDSALLHHNLSGVLVHRSLALGDPAMLEEAVTIARQVIHMAPGEQPDRASRLSGLGTATLAFHAVTGRRGLLEEAVDALRETAAATPEGHFLRAQRLSNLALALYTRYSRGGPPDDGDEAVDAAREAVRAAPPGHVNLGQMLSNLGAALQARYTRTGSRGDLNDAVHTLRDAVTKTPADHLYRGRHLSNLSVALLNRFGITGSGSDLDDAVAALREATRAMPDGNLERALHLSNLAYGLQELSARSDSPADLDEAITAAREAVGTLPDGHPSRVTCLSGLGTALGRRFQRSGAREDCEDAVGALREAVRIAPEDHPHRAVGLANLGEALHSRFGAYGDPADLSESLTRYHEALAVTPEDDPGRAVLYSNLALALGDHADRSGDPADREAVSQAWLRAWGAPTAAASVRLRAARSLIGHLSDSDPEQAADIAEAAVLLLPEVAPRQLERGDRQRAVSEFEGLTGAAGGLVLASGQGTDQERSVRTLRLLETGRSVLLSQGLETRSDLSELRAEHPLLAERYVELRELLDSPAPAFPPVMMTDLGTGSEGLATPDRTPLAREFTALTAHIRAQPGFQRFGLPPSSDELLHTARTDSVVVINLSFQRCDALLLTRDGITHVELPDLVGEILVDQVITFRDALADGWRASASSQRRQAQRAMSGVLEWLWDAVTGPVLDALGHDREPGPDDPWPRVWWVPGGLLGLLPLHAAGHHTEPGPGRRTVMDRVISSYTPTVRALGHAREQDERAATGPSRSSRGLVVAMPTTPGLPDGKLDHADQEAETARALLPGVTLLREDPGAGTANPALPTKANVLAQLTDCAFAHFVCHGRTHPQDPSRSMLLLHDHEADPFTVRGLAPVALDGAKLAYLSACSTAGADITEALDEAIHLASAFQLAGFPHVIGTLWEIDDQIAVTVARTFYENLRTDSGELDPARAALALHAAVRAVRDGDDMPGSYDRTRVPFLWASYLHAGA